MNNYQVILSEKTNFAITRLRRQRWIIINYSDLIICRW